MIKVDFSDNYVTKYANAVQSQHFGASQNQVTLHTGVLYLGESAKPQKGVSRKWYQTLTVDPI